MSDALGLDSIDNDDAEMPDFNNLTSNSETLGKSSSTLSLSELATSFLNETGGLGDNLMSSMEAGGRPRTLKWRAGSGSGMGLNRRYRWVSRSCRSLRLSGPPPVTQINVPHPFSGTLASQLKCTECGYKVFIVPSFYDLRNKLKYLFVVCCKVR